MASAATEEETLFALLEADKVVGVTISETWDVCPAIGTDSVAETEDALSEAAAELALVKNVSLVEEDDS